MDKIQDIKFRYTDTQIGRVSSFVLDDTLIVVPDTQELYDLMSEVNHRMKLQQASEAKKILVVPL